MKRSVVTGVSGPGRLVCPGCEVGALLPAGPFTARCGSCGLPASYGVLQTLREIVALPDALGRHASECGHPGMRRLPDGTRHCPVCRAEVSSFDARQAERGATRHGRR